MLELGRHYEIRPHSRPQIFLDRKYFYRAFLQCCGSGSGIRCLFDPLDPGSGMGRKSASGSGIRDEQPGSYFLELRNHFLVVLGLKCGSGMETDWIRDGKSRIWDPG